MKNIFNKFAILILVIGIFSAFNFSFAQTAGFDMSPWFGSAIATITNSPPSSQGQALGHPYFGHDKVSGEPVIATFKKEVNSAGFRVQHTAPKESFSVGPNGILLSSQNIRTEFYSSNGTLLGQQSSYEGGGQGDMSAGYRGNLSQGQIRVDAPIAFAKIYIPKDYEAKIFYTSGIYVGTVNYDWALPFIEGVKDTTATYKFKAGDRVVVSGVSRGLLTRHFVASSNYSAYSECIQPVGSQGVIVDGPIFAPINLTSFSNQTWWDVNYDERCDGWSLETGNEGAYLAKAGTAGTTNSSTVTTGTQVVVSTTSNTGLNTRSSASTSAPVLCQQSSGSKGQVINGPVTANGYTWWEIDYGSGCSGWSAGEYLKDSSGSTVIPYNNTTTTTNTTSFPLPVEPSVPLSVDLKAGVGGVAFVDSTLNVNLGSPVTLSWKVAGVGVCYKSSSPVTEFTGLLTPLNSGTQTTYTSVGTIEYRITCGTKTDSVIVNTYIGNAPVNNSTNTSTSGGTTTTVVGTSPSTNTFSTKFTSGDTVQASSNVNIRSSANGTVIGLASAGTSGTVQTGPILTAGVSWWKVTFSNGISGWSAENYLAKKTQSPTVASKIPVTPEEYGCFVSNPNVIVGRGFYSGYFPNAPLIPLPGVPIYEVEPGEDLTLSLPERLVGFNINASVLNMDWTRAKIPEAVPPALGGGIDVEEFTFTPLDLDSGLGAGLYDLRTDQRSQQLLYGQFGIEQTISQFIVKDKTKSFAPDPRAEIDSIDANVTISNGVVSASVEAPSNTWGVEFYGYTNSDNSSRQRWYLGTDTQAPYEVSWRPEQPGKVVITANAISEEGAVSCSLKTVN